MNATITSNTIDHPGTTSPFDPRFGAYLVSGSGGGSPDTFQTCLGLSNNTLSSGGDAPTNVDVRVRQRQSTIVKLPGYSGAATDTAAVQSFVASKNTGATVSASANAPGGFADTAACPVP